MRMSRVALLLPFAILLAGCGGGDNTTKPVTPNDELPVGTPAADSPAHLIQRLEATWESQNATEYALLLSDDFRFHFSPASDPELADKYGNNWTRSVDVQAMRNLFAGFTDSLGNQMPAASTVVMLLANPQYTDYRDSSDYYKKVAISSFIVEIQVPSSAGPIVYQVNSRQELYLVRSDAAVVAGGSIADPSHWYIRQWDDLAGFSATVGKGPVINPESATSIGRIKATYVP